MADLDERESEITDEVEKDGIRLKGMLMKKLGDNNCIESVMKLQVIEANGDEYTVDIPHYYLIVTEDDEAVDKQTPQDA